MKKIVFSGGTYAGKTTMIEYLHKKGYDIFPEIALENMSLLRELMGDKGYKNWRTQNFLEFQYMNVYASLKVYNYSLKFKGTKSDVIFYDRGVFDWFASLKRENILIPESLENLVKNVYYDMVFIFDILPEHVMREDTGRMLDYETASRWSEYIMKEYEDRGTQVIRVPYFDDQDKDTAIKNRAQYILDFIK